MASVIESIPDATDLDSFKAAVSSLDGRQFYAHLGPYRLTSHFQPIVSFCYGRTVGYEALLRAQDKSGVVPPRVLMQLADTTNALERLDHLSRYLHVTNFAGAELPTGWLFLNIHPEVLCATRDSRKPKFLSTIADQFGITPNRIVLEILEEEVKDVPGFEAGIEEARLAGFGIAIDDFGAGHSNFDRIWRIRPNIVKLDQSYALRAAQDPIARRMLPRIVGLLHEAGVLVLLEGIETADQAELAMDSDIDFAQGYFFACPAPIATFSEFSASAIVSKVWESHEEKVHQKWLQHRERISPYLNALGYGSTLLAAGRSMEDACSGFLGLPLSDRCYLLDEAGIQVGPNHLSNRFPPTVALAELQDTSKARWSRRPYFTRAVTHPGTVQITRPYRSVASANLCVTASISIRCQNRTQVLCGDLVWDDNA